MRRGARRCSCDDLPEEPDSFRNLVAWERRIWINLASMATRLLHALASTRTEWPRSRRPRSVRIAPFRGVYFLIRPERQFLARDLIYIIYPVPNPQLPFLGVHFTRMIRGGVETGPNAVLALAREGYTRTDVSIPDLADSFSFPACGVSCAAIRGLPGGRRVDPSAKRNSVGPPASGTRDT
jgi:hypothetical protein